ncbi:anti-virulence regulator CigR family protein [Oceanimonas sp. CHS3-5]|uniref:anti-virulence regulator CigR family protein n=1 Tax=Oceanimonas sp. CHS3-5 TaxID=3068186 RepID=UPI00273DD6ED|nr:anti-virulence regulator CigR family protein [Oceanimonas sp. CHS3-5]MDP5292770.1 anti-virulence regulator CigR family protein [Oceanimonas sp. CHS3-5]
MNKHTLIASLLLAGLALPAQAQPPEGKGPDHAHGRHKEQQEQRWQREADRDRSDRREYREERRDYRHEQDRRYDRDLRVDERLVRRLFREHRDWLDYDGGRRNLPPGIAKNLRRGKPLPPGIAKRFDPRLRDRLPYYEGYEWRRVDNKAVLVDLATENVRYILEDILD